MEYTLENVKCPECKRSVGEHESYFGEGCQQTAISILIHHLNIVAKERDEEAQRLRIATDVLKLADRYWFGDEEKGVVCSTCDFGSIGEDHDKNCPIGAAHKALVKIGEVPHA